MPETTTITVDPDGTIRDIDGPLDDQPRGALVVREPDRLATAPSPVAMIEFATKMATALADIVERQKLYSTISGRKFPQVEAWMTVGRMDNVVAREAEHPIRHEDGSYEAFVELVRLSDGLVVGRASALCGTPDDKPWATRGEPQRRSMAVTRATSRAFRQQYSWIMALAGYEPTPADEMPGTPDTPEPPPPAGEVEELVGIESREGTVKIGGGQLNQLDVRQTPEGPTFGFSLDTGKGNIPQVILEGDLAAAVLIAEANDPKRLTGHWCRVKGRIYSVRQAGHRGYFRMRVTEFETRDYKLPAETTGPVATPDAAGVPSEEPAAVPPAPSLPMFDEATEAELDGALR